MKISIEEYFKNSHPCNWFQIADELYHSLQVLRKDAGENMTQQSDGKGGSLLKPTVSRAFILLAGYTIENLLKGVLIVEQPQLLESGKIDNEISTGHNLVALAQKVALLDFEEDEFAFLRLLSEAIPYWGRYPVPKKWQHLKSEKILTDKLNNCFDRMYHKLRKAIYLQTRTGWTGPSGEEQGGWYCSDYDPDFPSAGSSPEKIEYLKAKGLDVDQDVTRTKV